MFYVGTFSKSMFSSIRVGFVVAPPWARAAIVSARLSSNWHVPLMNQMALATFISEGHLARHVRKMRGIYVERHKLLLSALHRHFAGQLTPLPALAGLHIAALLEGRASADQWVQLAASAGVKIDSVKGLRHGSTKPNGIIFGYGLIDASSIEDGIKLLKRAISTCAKSR